jgi:hypothetical protein
MTNEGFPEDGWEVLYPRSIVTDFPSEKQENGMSILTKASNLSSFLVAGCW